MRMKSSEFGVHEPKLRYHSWGFVGLGSFCKSLPGPPQGPTEAAREVSWDFLEGPGVPRASLLFSGSTRVRSLVGQAEQPIPA